MVLAAENDETRQTVSFLVACLVGIAIALAALTVWYWFHTDPKRRRQAVSSSGGDTEIIEARGAIHNDDGATELADEVPIEESDRPLVSLADGAGSGGDARAGDVRAGDVRAEDGVDHRFDEAMAEDDRLDAVVTGPLMARQTWDFVAAAKRAEDGGDVAVPPPPAAPRIAVPHRSGLAAAHQDEADELAVVRRRREQEAARGLSDEVWDSVRRSVFDKLDG